MDEYQTEKKLICFCISSHIFKMNPLIELKGETIWETAVAVSNLMHLNF